MGFLKAVVKLLAGCQGTGLLDHLGHLRFATCILTYQVAGSDRLNGIFVFTSRGHSSVRPPATQTPLTSIVAVERERACALSVWYLHERSGRIAPSKRQHSSKCTRIEAVPVDVVAIMMKVIQGLQPPRTESEEG